MRFECIGKTKGKLLSVAPQTKKMGQKDLQAAVKLRVRAIVANSALEMIYPGLRQFFYESSNQAKTEQKQLDGIPVVTDMPQLKAIGELIPSFRPPKLQQTGCKFSLDYGTGGSANIILGGATVDKFKIDFQDGGMTPIEFDVYSTDVDHDTFGTLSMLVNHDIEFELTAPEVVQEQIEEPEQTKPAKGKKGSKQTPEQALAAALGQTIEEPA
jgi:hypothetical protein